MAIRQFCFSVSLSMAHEKDTPVIIPEATLIGCATPEFAWVEELPALPDETIAEIRSLHAKSLKTAELDRLILNLQRGFATAVEMAQECCKLKHEAEKLANVKGQPNRPPVKLGVRSRNNLRELIEILEQAQAGKKRVKLEDFYQIIQFNQPLDVLVNLHLEARMGAEIVDPLKNVPIKAAEHLLGTLKYLEQSIDNGIKSGPDDVPINQLAWCFVTSFKDATGRFPRRNYDNYRCIDAGVGLETCRLMARELHVQLPENCRPEKPADMAKPYRRATEKLQKIHDTKP